jgi:hypothetical protein
LQESRRITQFGWPKLSEKQFAEVYRSSLVRPLRPDPPIVLSEGLVFSCPQRIEHLDEAPPDG